MKKLFFAGLALIGFAPIAQAAPIYGTVQITTSTTLTPIRQNGAFNVSSGTVVNLNASTASLNFLTGSTVTYSSATFTKASIGTGMVTALTGSTITYSSATFSNANITTIGSSLTVQGNFGVAGAVTNPLTVTSSSTLNGNVLFSSMVGTNFTASTATISFFHGGYILLQSSQSLVAQSSATAAGTFVPTQILVTLTPRNVSSIFKITVTGSMEQSTQGNNSMATITRNGTNLAGASGFCMGITNTGGAARWPCSMTVYDSPATTSALTYRIAITAQSGTTTWGTSSGTPTSTALIVEEMAN